MSNLGYENIRIDFERFLLRLPDPNAVESADPFVLVRDRIRGVPAFFRELLRRWRLFDVEVAKADLVANYKRQFNKIMRDHEFEELLRRLEPFARNKECF